MADGVGSVGAGAPAGGGGFGGDAGGGIGSIGGGGAGSFDLGGIAPDGGGAAPTGTGDLGAAGLSPIGTTGLDAFGTPGADAGQAAQLDQYNALVQQNTDTLNSIAQQNQALSASAVNLGGLPSLATQPFDPMRFDALPSTVPSFTTPSPFTGMAALPSAFPPAPTEGTFQLVPDALASPVTSPAVTTPTVTPDPFTPIDQGGLGLTPIGTTAANAFGLGGPVTDPTLGVVPTADAATPTAADAALLSPQPLADQTGLLGPPPEANAATAFDATPVAQWGATPQMPAAPPQIGYGDQPLGVPVSQMSGLTSQQAQDFVGGKMDSYRDPNLSPPQQDAALQQALDAAYAYRVQGGDTGPFDRIAEQVAGDPRAQAELTVARDRAQALVDAGVSGNIRALNNNGVNFGAQLYDLQRAVTNDPDNAISPISRFRDGLRYGEGAGSGVNAVETGAMNQTMQALGFGRELQDATAYDAQRTEADQVQERQKLAGMSTGERVSYLLGKAMDAGALASGPAIAAAIVGAHTPGAPQAQGNITYGALDSLGRPTGVQATITRNMIGTGTAADPSILPPGWAGNGTLNNQARAHLLGRQLGGSGNVAENLVTMQQNPANSPVMSGFERQIRQAVEGGQTVRFSATPIYDGTSLLPRGVTLGATGSRGFNLNATILNPH